MSRTVMGCNLFYRTQPQLRTFLHRSYNKVLLCGEQQVWQSQIAN